MVTWGFGGMSLRATVDAEVLGGGGVWNPLGCISSASKLRSVLAGEMDSLKRLLVEVGL